MIELIKQYYSSLLHILLNVVSSIRGVITILYLRPLKSSRGHPCPH